MSEQILHDYMPGRQNLDKLKGTVTVELFDAKTNKKVLEYSSTNFIANFAKEYFRYLEDYDEEDSILDFIGKLVHLVKEIESIESGIPNPPLLSAIEWTFDMRNHLGRNDAHNYK